MQIVSTATTKSAAATANSTFMEISFTTARVFTFSIPSSAGADSVFFGFMFGDAGQGLCLLIGGFLLYKAKKMSLAAIVSCCGFFSTIFGFLFGSIFGFEDIIEAIWLRPGQAMTTLPFIGKLNTVFVVAVALGMGVILLTMILNIINSIRVHDAEKTWFDTNGAAGLVFYGALASVIVLFMTGHPLPAGIVLAVMFGIPLLLMFFKEPLTAIADFEEKGKTDPLFAKLAELVAETNGLWNAKAEKYLLENAPSI